jgi:hypothetical protein
LPSITMVSFLLRLTDKVPVFGRGFKSGAFDGGGAEGWMRASPSRVDEAGPAMDTPARRGHKVLG